MLQLPIYQNQTDLQEFSIPDLFGSFLAASSELAWIGPALLTVFFAIISSILFYHWKNFGFEKRTMLLASLIYFSVSTVLILSMGVSLFVYLNSL